MAVGPGNRLDAYELVRPLGAGGMGEVWLARDTHLGRKVAIKLLPHISQPPTPKLQLPTFQLPTFQFLPYNPTPHSRLQEVAGSIWMLDRVDR